MGKEKKSDVILIGAGVMSATLGAMLKELAPDWEYYNFRKSCPVLGKKVPTSGIMPGQAIMLCVS